MRKLALVSTLAATGSRNDQKTMKQTSPNDEYLRALALLASCPNGCTGATLLVEHDHSSETIVGHLGGTIEIARVKITAKGRLALRVSRVKIE